jgi:branched-chain amino acid transport system permease protein
LYINDLFQILISGILMGSIYALVALGFFIIFNATDVLNFAQGDQVVFGGVVAYTFFVILKLPLIFTFVVTFLIGWIVGAIYEGIVVRPLLRVSMLGVILATLAVASIFQNTVVLIWGKNPLSFPSFSGEAPVQISHLRIIPQFFWTTGISLIILTATKLFFDHTLIGRAMKAVANNRLAARLVAINPMIMTSVAFGLSAGLMGIAGILIAPITFAGGYIGMSLTTKAFAGALLGGLGNIFAVITGSFLFGTIEALVSYYVTSGFKEIFAFATLIFILLVKPEGLFVFKKEK